MNSETPKASWLRECETALDEVREKLQQSDEPMAIVVTMWPRNSGGPPVAPIPMLLWCPECCARHIDQGEFATKLHHTHACQSCGMVWRPAIVPTVGVQFLPGFKDDPQ
jgi:hypothetical protein